MVRIKGANSDYTYIGVPETAPIKEDLNSDPLYLELFICPNNQPSRVEPHEGDRYCNGTDAGCPEKTHAGHVKVRLEKDKGVVLSAKDVDALTVSDTAVTSAVPLQVANALQVSNAEVKATAPLNVSKALTVTVGNPPVTLKVSPDGISMQAPGGAEVTIDASGAIALAGNTIISGNMTVSGNVNISGNVTVSGEVTVTNKVTFSGNGKIAGPLDLSDADITFSQDTVKEIRRQMGF
ncbi:MAG: polymer-forming cytoskeletal protein [Cyanobacteria bacterium J06598_1]